MLALIPIRFYIYAAIIIGGLTTGYAVYSHVQTLKATVEKYKQDDDIKTQQLLQLDQDRKDIEKRMTEAIDIQKRVVEQQQTEIISLRKKTDITRIRIEGAKTIPEKEIAINDSFQKAVWCIEQVTLSPVNRDKKYGVECDQ